jgi:hypothetical protein
MRGWILFAIMTVLVFGIPLLEDVHAWRVRRAAKRAAAAGVDAPVSLVPGDDVQPLPQPNDVAPVAKAKELAA